MLHISSTSNRRTILVYTPAGYSDPANAGRRYPVVFLLHGVLATAGVFELLERRLRQVGIEHVASFSYHPLRSIESLARELGRACDSMPARARVHLVGHTFSHVDGEENSHCEKRDSLVPGRQSFLAKPKP